jgi:hypothetical protein
MFAFIPSILTSLRPAPNAFKNALALSLTKPSVLLMAWFLMSVATFSHILLSSAFKQFKHFFALSLLITFSLNAFSVDDPQQLNKEALNKEAYLDLVATFLPSWSVLPELVEPRAVRAAPATSLSIVIASNRRSESNDSRRTTINLGIGHRLLVEDDMAIVGINVFTDYETKSRHRRLSLGLEYQRTNFSANINTKCI